MPTKTAIIYYAGFVRFGGVLSHARVLRDQLQRNEWVVTLITLDKLPSWCRYLPHAIEKIVNFFNRPLGYYYKDRATRILYKLYFGHKVELRVFEDIYISWNSSTPSITILHAAWSDNLQSNPVTRSQQDNLIAHEIKLINEIEHSLVTVSEPYLKYLSKEHFSGRLTKKLGVVELGVDQSKFHRCKIRDTKSIIFVGVLEARKNVLFLLRVFKAIKQITNSYKLTIAGDGPEMNMLREFANFNELDVNFLGALSHDAVISEMQLHGLYVHTSVKESFSYSLLEAKLAGLTTCALSDLQVPKEFIDIGIDSFDVDEWCDRILNIEFTTTRFNADRYTVERMTSRTLELAV